MNHLTKKTRAKRKLLAKSTLVYVCSLEQIGVPVSRILRDLDLNMTRPTLDKLVSWYTVNDLEQSNKVESSLFPPWIDPEGKDAQENPDDWYYVGRFPFGEWKYDENE